MLTPFQSLLLVLGFALLLSLFLMRYRWGSRPDKCREESLSVMAGNPDTPRASEWCSAAEGLVSGSVLCVDEALCLVAAGTTALQYISEYVGLELAPEDLGDMHLVDLFPPDSVALVLQLAAEARRGTVRPRRLQWKAQTVELRAAVFACGWISLSITSVAEGI